jgi:hypothetical protein
MAFSRQYIQPDPLATAAVRILAHLLYNRGVQPIRRRYSVGAERSMTSPPQLIKSSCKTCLFQVAVIAIQLSGQRDSTRPIERVSERGLELSITPGNVTRLSTQGVNPNTKNARSDGSKEDKPLPNMKLQGNYSKDEL